ncbi:uncharacterized protein LOC132079272 [Ammospiza nelsoni]|uniref:uncharacterized protein LOC132079272 n=1 Tax=Ammospiza nelsoni TaxID=2857394 RepID=UPI002869BC52|nr:uncharacterized protein LOC132079272 [Ammospiza nelsoni]
MAAAGLLGKPGGGQERRSCDDAVRDSRGDTFPHRTARGSGTVAQRCSAVDTVCVPEGSTLPLQRCAANAACMSQELQPPTGGDARRGGIERRGREGGETGGGNRGSRDSCDSGDGKGGSGGRGRGVGWGRDHMGRGRGGRREQDRGYRSCGVRRGGGGVSHWRLAAARGGVTAGAELGGAAAAGTPSAANSSSSALQAGTGSAAVTARREILIKCLIKPVSQKPLVHTAE